MRNLNFTFTNILTTTQIFKQLHFFEQILENIFIFLLLSSFDFAVVDIPCIVSGMGSRPCPLSFYVEEAGTDAKLIQHGPLGVVGNKYLPYQL
jgi:hypothetical protein